MLADCERWEPSGLSEIGFKLIRSVPGCNSFANRGVAPVVRDSSGFSDLKASRAGPMPSVAERVAERLGEQLRLGRCWKVSATRVLGPACERVVALGELARGLWEGDALAAEDAYRGRNR